MELNLYDEHSRRLILLHFLSLCMYISIRPLKLLYTNICSDVLCKYITPILNDSQFLVQKAGIQLVYAIIEVWTQCGDK